MLQAGTAKGVGDDRTGSESGHLSGLVDIEPTRVEQRRHDLRPHREGERVAKPLELGRIEAIDDRCQCGVDGDEPTAGAIVGQPGTAELTIEGSPLERPRTVRVAEEVIVDEGFSALDPLTDVVTGGDERIVDRRHEAIRNDLPD